MLISELLVMQKDLEKEKEESACSQKFNEFLKRVSDKNTQMKINKLVSER